MPESLQTATPQGLPFIVKLYQILSTPSYRSFISWGNQGLSFVVHDAEAFSKVLPLHFKHNNVSSFARQLNIYGFRKVGEGEFRHELFVRGAPELLGQIRRRSSKPPHKAARVSSTLPQCMPDAQYRQHQPPQLVGTNSGGFSGNSNGGCCEPLDLADDEFDLLLSEPCEATAPSTAAASAADGTVDARHVLAPLPTVADRGMPLSPSPSLPPLPCVDLSVEHRQQQRQAQLLSPSLLVCPDPELPLLPLSASAMDIVPSAATAGRLPAVSSSASSSLSPQAAPTLPMLASVEAALPPSAAAVPAVSQALASLTSTRPAAAGAVVGALGDGELQRLRDMNNLLSSRLDKLQRAHEATQGTVSLILEIFTRSVRDQQQMESRLSALTEQLADARATISLLLGGTGVAPDARNRQALTTSAELTAEDLTRQITNSFQHDEFFHVTDGSDEVFNFFSSVGAPEGR